MKEKITRSSGNVFSDLGFPSGEAAKLLGVTQPRVSDLYKGKIHLFSIDTLVDMLVHPKVSFGFISTVTWKSTRNRYYF